MTKGVTTSPLWSKLPENGLEFLGTCPICKAKDRKLLYSGLTDRVFHCVAGEWTLQLCSGCGAAYLDPRPTIEMVNLVYSNYFTHISNKRETRTGIVRHIVRGLRHGYLNKKYGYSLSPSISAGKTIAHLVPPFKAKADRSARHLSRRPLPGGCLLDIGCGNGAFLEKISRAGWRCQGIDIDPQVISVARKRGLDVTQGTLASCNFPREHFDVITLNHVVEHVHDPIQLLEECHRILRPFGLLWLSTPNLRAVGHWFYRKDWMPLDPPRHLVIFTPESLRHSLEQLNFNVKGPLWPGFHVRNQSFYKSFSIRIKADAFQSTSLPWKLKVLAWWLELITWFRPAISEEIVYLARKMPS